MELESTPVVPALDGAACANHPERAAMLTCERCGDFVCHECRSHERLTRCARCAGIVGVGAAVTQGRYYYTPPWRFMLESVLTLGIYDIYWFERNWRRIKATDQSVMWPLARAIFGRLYYFSLIKDMNTRAAMTERMVPPLSVVLGVGYFIANALGRLPEPWFLISALSGAFVLPSVIRAGELVSEAERVERSKIRPRHIVLWIVGGLVWMLMILGFLAPEDPGATGF